jgi:hypothetical protein
LCGEHQRDEKATSKEERDKIWKSIELKLVGEIQIQQMMRLKAGGGLEPFIPHSDCPKCDHLVDRYLSTQTWLARH